MADDRTLRVRLLAEIGNYQQGLRQAGQSTAEFGRNISGVGKASSADIEKVGRSALLMSAGMAAGLGASVKAAVDWETAWAGVTKTVDGTADQMSALEQGLRDMAKELPASHAEIAGVAEAAGQLGVSVTDVESFTRVMIDLGETTNLTADEAATSLARISNIMGTAGSDVERMGSTIVELGNNSATTEAEIVTLATRLAAAGQIAGLSEADVFAFASTLTSVGVEAEAGGTALSKVFTSIRDAVLDGSDNLDVFAEVAGLTVEQFSAAFREDAAGAITSFIEGLGRMNEAGHSTTGVFDELALTDQRLMRALLSTASAGTLLADQIDMANVAWGENTALQAEAEQRYQTTAAQMEMLRNQFADLGIDIGQVLLPALNGVVGGLSDMASGMAALPGPVKGVAVAVAGISTAGLGVIGTLGILGPKVVEARRALENMGTTGAFLNRNMGRMAAGLGVAGVALAGISYIAGQQAQKAREADARVQSWAEAIRDAGNAAEGASVYLQGLLNDTPDLASAMASAGVTVDEMSASVTEGGDAWEAMAVRLLEAAEAAGMSDGEVFGLAATLKGMAGEASSAEERADNLNTALDETGDAATDGADGAEVMADGLDEMEQAAEATEEALDALTDAFDRLLGVNLSAEAAAIAVNDAFSELPGIFEENGKSLDLATEAGRRNREAVSRLVGDIDSHVQAMIDQGATTDEVAWAMNAYRGRLVEVMRQAGFTESQISSYIATLGYTPENIDTWVALHGTAQAEQALNWLARDRTTRVYAVTIGETGTVGNRRAFAAGGFVDYLASGGEPAIRPRGTDTVAAMLTPGEFVVRKSAVDDLGVGFLDKLNAYGSGAFSDVAAARASDGGTMVVHHHHYDIQASSLDARQVGTFVRDAIESARRSGTPV